MNCPVCDMDQSPTQPQSGTHAYSIVYQCGSQYTYIVGDDDYEDAMIPCPFGECEHEWKCEWPGTYASLYQCTKCGKEDRRSD